MFRIDDATAATSLPTPESAGTEGYFTEGNPTAGTPATNVRGSWLNMIQEELRAVVVAGGLTPSKTTYNQVLAAIKRIGQNTVVLADTGAANAYTAVNAVPLVAGTWVDGVVQQVKIAHANTGASTYAPDGLTAIPIYGLGLQPLQGGELALNGTAVLMRATIAGVNSGNPIAVLMECAGGAQQIAPATQSQHAVQLGQVQQNYAWNHVIFASNTSGSFTVPANVYFIDVELWGGGGGGGGVGSANNGGGGGGGGGGYARKIFAVTPGQVIAFTIGAPGGAGGAGGNGGNGGTSTFSTLSAAGGAGGLANGSGNGGIGGNGTGGSVNGQGAAGGAAFSSGASLSGAGGGAPFGGCGAGSSPSIPAAGTAPGGGGSGAGSGGAGAGAAGAVGGIIICY